MTEPLIVYVLFHETNTGHSEESDGYVEAVYATEAQAEAAKLAAIRAAVDNGRDVWWNPDAPEGEEEGPADWDDDWHVEAHQVLTEPAAATLPPTAPAKAFTLPGAAS